MSPIQIMFHIDWYLHRLTEAKCRKERKFLGEQLEHYQNLLKKAK